MIVVAIVLTTTIRLVAVTTLTARQRLETGTNLVVDVAVASSTAGIVS